MMDSVLTWLRNGDASFRYLVHKYLQPEPEAEAGLLREQIAQQGWGQAFLAAQVPSGHWGKSFYQPKWISSHYTLLDLRSLEVKALPAICHALQDILEHSRGDHGSINEARRRQAGDVCVNGMFLNYAAFFGVEEEQLRPIVDYLLASTLPDGGYNCCLYTHGARHSSMHTTISVLEGMLEFRRQGGVYRQAELTAAQQAAEEFLLRHRLFRSDRTGEVIDRRWTMLSFPSRWRYDILRALVYFADAGLPYDPRLADGIDLLLAKGRADGTWPLQAVHPGRVHFVMEEAGKPSRWNTLRALRVLKAFRPELVPAEMRPHE